MTIEKKKTGTVLSMAITGRIDTMTAVELENELKKSLEGVTRLDLDFAEVEYISSAGLRVLLYAQKVMQRQGEMIIYHANKMVKEVFEITGFADILTVRNTK